MRISNLDLKDVKQCCETTQRIDEPGCECNNCPYVYVCEFLIDTLWGYQCNMKNSHQLPSWNEPKDWTEKDISELKQCLNEIKNFQIELEKINEK